jgi:hypothetical protein
MKKFLNILEGKFQELEESVCENNIKNCFTIEEISQKIDEMFEIYIDGNSTITNKFYRQYLKLLSSILKQQNKIENSKIEIVQIIKTPHGEYGLKNENNNF